MKPWQVVWMRVLFWSLSSRGRRKKIANHENDFGEESDFSSLSHSLFFSGPWMLCFWLSSAINLVYSCRFDQVSHFFFSKQELNGRAWLLFFALVEPASHVHRWAFSAVSWRLVRNCICMQAMVRTERKYTPCSEISIIIAFKFWSLVIRKMI